MSWEPTGFRPDDPRVRPVCVEFRWRKKPDPPAPGQRAGVRPQSGAITTDAGSRVPVLLAHRPCLTVSQRERRAARQANGQKLAPLAAAATMPLSSPHPVAEAAGTGAPPFFLTSRASLLAFLRPAALVW